MMSSSLWVAYLIAGLPRSLNLTNPTFLGGWLVLLPLPLPLLIFPFSAARSALLAISFLFIMKLVRLII